MFVNQDLKLRTEKKVEKLERECKEEDNAHWTRVSHLQKHNKVHACPLWAPAPDAPSLKTQMLIRSDRLKLRLGVHVTD